MKNFNTVCHFGKKETTTKDQKSELNLQNGQSSKFTFDSSFSSSENENSDDQAFIDDQEISDEIPGTLSEAIPTVAENWFQKNEEKNTKRYFLIN